MVPLELLDHAEMGEVAAVDGEPTLVSRLAAMGLRVGSAIRVLRAGSPCLIEVNSCRLSLRLDDASHVFVRPFLR